MCGRFVRHTQVRKLMELIRALDHPADPGPSYNIAPSQDILNAHEHDGLRVLVPMRWGLVPRWAKDAKKLHPINARAETVVSNGVFRLAFRTGRTLMPADGFYEWKLIEHGKQPFYVYRPDGQPMWFAGLSGTWRGGEQPQTTCAIITTAANEDMQPIHHRMPVIMTDESWDAWLDPDNKDWPALQRLLRPCPDGLITLRPVSTRVNNARNNVPELITAEPAA